MSALQVGTDAPTGLCCPSAPKAKRGRPLADKTLAIRDAVLALTEQYEQMTVRGVFYALEVRGIVPKTQEGGYRPVQAQVLKLRREGLLPWDFITDGTRWRRKPSSWRDADAFVDHMAISYRRDLWASQDVRLEVWLEKDALADLVCDVTDRWDVSLMVSRGQSSTTFIHSAAMAAEDAWRRDGISTFIYALYDRDAGGRRAARAIAQELPTYAPGCPIHFELLGVTDAQVTEWSLPTRPAKRSDPEAATFGDRAVELDAIPPDKLKALVEGAILRHVDPHAWKVAQAVEELEREQLRSLLGGGVS